MMAGDGITIASVVERFETYGARSRSWGSLHLVLEDGSVRDRDVETCIRLAEQAGDDEGAELGHLLLRMSKSQRRRLPRACEIIGLRRAIGVMQSRPQAPIRRLDESATEYTARLTAWITRGR